MRAKRKLGKVESSVPGGALVKRRVITRDHLGIVPEVVAVGSGSSCPW